MHTGVEMGAPRISSTVRNEISELLKNDPRISLREVASETGDTHTPVWNILLRELQISIA